MALAENLIPRLFRAAAGDDRFLLAAIANMTAAMEDKTGFLNTAARELALILTEDYPRLEFLLKEIADIR